MAIYFKEVTEENKLIGTFFAPKGKLPCPTCRELTAIPSSGIGGLKNDFKVRKIEEMFKTVNLREHKASQKLCDSCKAQSKSIVAK